MGRARSSKLLAAGSSSLDPNGFSFRVFIINSCFNDTVVICKDNIIPPS